MKKITLGIIAHVDSGKTTLSEALLYKSGTIRNFGRVDKGDSFLDTNSLERKRGITIYSKQAMFEYGDTEFTLLDTPGHSDFSAEMERTLQVLDYALLVISASDGITGQSENIWQLLKEYAIPVFIFFNKMDQQGSDYRKLIAQARSMLSPEIVDFGKDRLSREEFYDHAAMCSEEAMEEFLESGCVSDDTISDLIAQRRMFPCLFGSALKGDGIEELLETMDKYTMEADYPEEFGARVFKIIRDSAGRRLTMMKITGGVLKNRSVLKDGEEESKINQIRIYSGDKFKNVNEASAGDVCTVEGLKESFAGQGFGYESESILPLLAPVLSYRVILPADTDPMLALAKFKALEEESPELSIDWDEENKEIYVQVMGAVQLEVLSTVLKERFDLDASFDTGKILYKETITKSVIGVGHFEPLRHYAEVHLLMEPLPEGSGLEFASDVSTDLLAKNWQRLILTHLAEKQHRGVLTGSPVTDMKITVVGGKASNKHTMGGDFRKSVYRAVRQGLMMTESKLLEPYYRFSIKAPADCVGRIMTDLDRMKAVFNAPDMNGETAVFQGSVPVASFADYAKDLAAFTKGMGSVSVVPSGFCACHNEKEVIESIGYDPLRDVKNTPDSVFCAHGSGFIVPYDQVYQYMHVTFEQDGFADLTGAGQPPVSLNIKRSSASEKEILLGTEEIDSIISKISRSNAVSAAKKPGWKARKRKSGFGISDSSKMAADSKMHGTGNIKKVDITGIFEVEKADYLLVDGYNVIFAWEELNELARLNMDSARIDLMEKLCNYQAFTGSEVIVVFDAYRVKDHDTSVSRYLNINVVFTKEAETADQYIERFAHENARKNKVAVVTSDGLEQIIIRGQGCALVSSREFKEKIERIGK